MPTATPNPEASFASEFLKQYLRNGIGSMSKSDIDALVMHLLDLYANESGSPLGACSNQVASERLRATLPKIKRLRYEAGLKYRGNPAVEARRRFVFQLGKAGLEFDKEGANVAKIVFIVEDILAKNWIQGEIKEHGGVFDTSFNTEIVKVDPELFFKLLYALLNEPDVTPFREKYDLLIKKKNRDEITKGFKSLVSSFAKDATKAGLMKLVTEALLQLPAIGA